MKVSEKYNNQEYLKNVILFKKKKKSCLILWICTHDKATLSKGDDNSPKFWVLLVTLVNTNNNELICVYAHTTEKFSATKKRSGLVIWSDLGK